MARSVVELTEADRALLAERHLATFTTLRADGSPHVVPVGFSFDDETGLVRIICSGDSQKAVNSSRNGRGVVCLVDGARWLALEGSSVVSDEPHRVAEAERLHTLRYRPPPVNPKRVVIELTVDRVLGSA
jgi:PPOX class probable F420-dependent enzyme